MGQAQGAFRALQFPDDRGHHVLVRMVGAEEAAQAEVLAAVMQHHPGLLTITARATGLLVIGVQ
ncbi:hypothetical protein ACFFX0_18195 [Citricoccus parietis]|uniref:Uncharacterized protein n=1 Tax=Citricoccus parietis TaxID=592307 RepID=A0ABV5G276_9MICC